MIYDVAIIGGGFSGTMAAVHLLRLGCPRVALIEAQGRLAAGVAYSTDEPFHLLNVPARNMSALAGEPDHFADWLEARHGLGPDGFAPRRLYRRYLRELLSEAADDRLALVEDEAVAVEADAQGLAVSLRSGATVHCDRLVLAGGNLAPRRPPLREAADQAGIDYIADPWSSEGRRQLRDLAGQGADVLILGTGLTMVDVCLTLSEHGFAGRIVATSRRGLVPRSHAPFEPAPLAAPPPARLGELLRETRRRAQRHGWRAAVDALRPYSTTLWQGFSLAERRRFRRHLRPYWDVHRHRIAPEVGARLDRLLADRQLEVIAGRSRIEGDEVVIARRGGDGEAWRRVAAIVNCTGPGRDIADAADPLLQSLFKSGLARPDPLGIGLEVDDQSRLPADGRVHVVGPLSRGAYWEIVAVPDIRGQAEAVARAIIAPAA